MSNLSSLENMVKQQLLTNRIEEDDVIDLFYSLPRADFFDEPLKNLVYSDARLPLNATEESLTPLEEASILQALDLQGSERVLEIGTGCGYLSALLASRAKEVITVEQAAELTEKAKERFKQHKLDNILALTGDASRGWMDKGPYDVIVIGGGINEIGNHFKPQLMRGGKLFAFIGKPPCFRATLLTLDSKDDWQSITLFDTDISPLTTTLKQETFAF